MSAPNYNWTCNACGASVKAGVNSCSECGCAAGASGNETEKRRDPDGYLRKLKYKKFEASVLSIIYGPAFVFALVSSGRFLELLILIIALVTLTAMEWEKLRSAFQDKTYLINCVTLGGLVFSILVARVYFAPELIVNYLWIGLPIMLIATYYLLIGKKGKEACERFNGQHV